MNLYVGKILNINLTTGEIKTEDLNEDWAQDYIGGKGLGFCYLFNQINPETDPLCPSNALIFMTGPIAGTIIPCSSRLCVVTKSPATGTILDSNMGGSFGAEMKYAGYDGIIIKGKAKEPVYIVINDDLVEIRSASELWSKGIFEIEGAIKRSLDDENFKIASIGQAGENLIPFACISNEYYRHAGRGGCGAVMGSKNLKAIAIKGSRGVKVANLEPFLDLAMKLQSEGVSKSNDLTKDNTWVIQEGSAYLVDYVNELGILPTKNFQMGVWESVDKINSNAVKRKKKKDRACFSCPLGCGKFTCADGSMIEGPEYETLSLAGSNCGIDDLDSIIKFNELCDNFGLDTISTGNVIAFAMEMTEKGIHDFGVTFGDRKNYLLIPEEIANLKGRGKDLGLGVRALSTKYGGKEFAMEVKGLEFPGYDPRGNYGIGLAWATSERGACHLRSVPMSHPTPFDLTAMVKQVISDQHRLSVKSSFIFCYFFHTINISDEMAQVLNIGMGAEKYAEKYSEEDLWRTGERIWNLGRLFNIKAGLSMKDDYLPPRIYREGLLNGPNRGRMLSEEEFNKMLQMYYKDRGWDINGIPKKEKLEQLKMDVSS